MEADFVTALKDFPKHVILHIAGLMYSWLTVFEDLALLIGSASIFSKNRKARGLGVYLLLWLYFRRR